MRTAAGARIRRPEAGAVNSLEQLRLTRRERSAFAHRTYDGAYPSLHLTFSATENLLERAAYAGTYGRLNFTDIVPRTVATAADLDDDDPEPITGRGTLTIRNPALKPWTADNFDLSFEYYTPQGGVVSAGIFRKEIRNFFGDSAWTLTLRWNYRGQDRRLPQAAFGPDGYEYYKARTTVDVNASYQLTRRLALAASVNNLTSEPQTLLRYGSQTPAYARQYQESEYAIQMAVGLRGTF